MQPSEEEIRELLANVCRHSVMTDGEWRATVAHAIAEKLAEGVVWQREGVIQHLPIPPFGVNVHIYMPEENGYRVLRIATGKPEDAPVPDGQRVRVTVTREESDGQKSAR